jgi:hypothetical protein
MVDLSKAFDRATGSVTIKALCRLGLPEPVIFWTFNYMSGRTQAVRNSRGVSNWLWVSSGVPQGSVLGPFLFATIVNDLKAISHNSVIVKYADDLTLIHFVRKAEDNNLPAEWKHILRWCEGNQLQVNTKKTKLMEFSTSAKLSVDLTAINNGLEIDLVQSSKLLGVTFSSDFKWDLHISLTLEKASRRLFSLIALRSVGVPPKTLWNVYDSLVRSILLYGCQAWCNCSQGLWDKVEKIERRASRIIQSPLPENMLPVKELANRICMRLVKNVIEKSDHPLREIVTPCETIYVTRRNRKFTSCWAKTTRLKNSITRFADLLE